MSLTLPATAQQQSTPAPAPAPREEEVHFWAQSLVPDTPSIGGQPLFFVVAQLFLFRRGARANAPMTEVANSMTDDDLRAFGAWISTLPPPKPPAEPADPARVKRGAALVQQRPCGSLCVSTRAARGLATARR